MEWLLSKLLPIQTLMQSGFGNLSKDWGTKWYLIALMIFGLIIGVSYCKKTKSANSLTNSAETHRKKADSLATITQSANKAVVISEKNVQKSENERVRKNYNIDTLIPDSLQSEIDREFNFPEPRPPNER
jgi:hypothetical protein